jgi:hypothetical protein
MADAALAVSAALVGQFLVSRLLMFALKRLAQVRRGLAVIHLVSWLATSTALAYALADGGPPRFVSQALAGLLPALVWLVIDVLRLMRRRAKLRDAVAISRMR